MRKIEDGLRRGMVCVCIYLGKMYISPQLLFSKFEKTYALIFFVKKTLISFEFHKAFVPTFLAYKVLFISLISILPLCVGALSCRSVLGMWVIIASHVL